MANRPSQVQRLAAAEVAYTLAHDSDNDQGFNRADAVLDAVRRSSSEEEIAAGIREHNRRLGLR